MNRKQKKGLLEDKPLPIRKSKKEKSKRGKREKSKCNGGGVKPNKGFGTSRQDALRSSQGRKHYAIELNKEYVPEDGNLYNCEVEDVIQIRHISVRPPTSHQDKFILSAYMDMVLETVEGDRHMLVTELLATLYLSTINDYALDIGANIGRIYHNSCLGDTRIRANSVGHLFEPCNKALPLQAQDLVEKYVTLEHVADGSKVTLRDRLGKG